MLCEGGVVETAAFEQPLMALTEVRQIHGIL